MKAFSKLNPIAETVYFIAVICMSVFIMNPICLAISLVSAFLCAVSICGGKKALKNILCIFPTILIAAVMNPAFNHEGATIIRYLPGGNPLTLESIAYGFAAGAMLAGVICHFTVFNAVMTSDKLIYLTGRLSPALSLVFSMAVKMVPDFIRRFKEVSAAQKGIGRDVNVNGIMNKFKNIASICMVVINRSLEESVETADSMKSRGYGLKKRTLFSIFKFDGRDGVVLAYVLICSIYIIYSYITDAIAWQYFPYMSGEILTVRAISVYVIYGGLMIMPAVINEMSHLVYGMRKKRNKNEHI